MFSFFFFYLESGMGSESFDGLDCRICLEMFRDMGCSMDAKQFILFECNHCGDIFNSAGCEGNIFITFFFFYFHVDTQYTFKTTV